MPARSLNRNPWNLLCAALYTGAALAAVPGLFLIRDPDSVYAFRYALYYVYGVADRGATEAYVFLRAVVLALAFLGPAMMAALTWAAYTGPRGFRAVSLAARGVFWACCALGAGLGILFVYKAAAFSIRVIRAGLGILALSMLFSEGVLAAMDGFFLYQTTVLLRQGWEAADSLHYMALSGKPDPSGIAPGMCVRLYLAGAAAIALGLLRLPDVPGALAFGLCGCGSVLMGVLLHNLRRNMERAVFLEKSRQRPVVGFRRTE